jgi:hypothetical protein
MRAISALEVWVDRQPGSCGSSLLLKAYGYSRVTTAATCGSTARSTWRPRTRLDPTATRGDRRGRLILRKCARDPLLRWQTARRRHRAFEYELVRSLRYQRAWAVMTWRCGHGKRSGFVPSAFARRSLPDAAPRSPWSVRPRAPARDHSAPLPQRTASNCREAACHCEPASRCASLPLTPASSLRTVRRWASAAPLIQGADGAAATS